MAVQLDLVAACEAAAYADLAVSDFCQIRGHETAKRALEIAAVGNHAIHLFGRDSIGIRHLMAAFPSVGGDISTIVPDPRAELCIDLMPISDADLLLPPPAEKSPIIAARVSAARLVLGSVRGIEFNARQLSDQAAEHDLDVAAAARVARSIAALDGANTVKRIHFAEALSYSSREAKKP